MHHPILVVGNVKEVIKLQEQFLADMGVDYIQEHGGRFKGFIITKDGEQVARCQVKDIDVDAMDAVDRIVDYVLIADEAVKDCAKSPALTGVHGSEFVSVIDIHV